MREHEAAVEADGNRERGVAVEHDAPERRVLQLLQDGAVLPEDEDGRPDLVGGDEQPLSAGCLDGHEEALVVVE